MGVSAVLTAALSNAPRPTIPWTKRPARSTPNGKSGAHTPPTTPPRSPMTVQHHLPVLAFRVTPSLSVSGTHPLARLTATTANQQLLPPFLTIQSTSTLAMALLPVISAVAVVPAITVP